MNTILVTGGAGYIGSHTVACLLEAGYRVVVVDNLCNSNARVFAHVAQIAGIADDAAAPGTHDDHATTRHGHGTNPLTFHQGDVRDRSFLDSIFVRHAIDAVIHFAGLKAVGESVQQPLKYYSTNVHGTLQLLEAMDAAQVRQLVFSSSATVYGPDAPVPYVETLPLGQPSSPYGASKAMVERMLADLAAADERWSLTCLRYFNPIGAHPSGLIGEAPQGTPNNLMPYISQVAVGTREALSVFGDDYPTPDGTCIRDYLHVMDLAEGHVRALERAHRPGLHAYNLGTGHGVSVLEMVRSFEKVTGQRVPYRIAPRRAGDLPAFWADASKAREALGWAATRSLADMMADTWRWQSRFPQGFAEH